jgi:uncharacterized membrane protein YfcA
MNGWLILSGALVGLIVGATGMGGGVIMTPLLLFVFGVPPKMAVGTDLIFATTTKLFGAWQHFQQRTIDFDLLKKVLLGSVPGTLAGMALLGWIERSYGDALDLFIKKTLGGAFLLIALVMVWQLIRGRNKMEDQAEEGRVLKRSVLAPLGFLIGFLVAITSVGSGTLFMAMLLSVYPFAIARLVGTDIVHGVTITAIASIGHSILGTIDMSLTGNLLVGSIPGVLLGSRLSRRLPERVIRLVLVVLLVLTACKLL